MTANHNHTTIIRSHVEYRALNDRPLMRTTLSDGCSPLLVYDWRTGTFVDGFEYEGRLEPGKDVDTFTEEGFAARIAGLRAGLSYEALSIEWTFTDDETKPYRGEIGGRVATVAVNDDPTQPLYTLIIEGRPGVTHRWDRVASFRSWPPAWRHPEALKLGEVSGQPAFQFDGKELEVASLETGCFERSSAGATFRPTSPDEFWQRLRESRHRVIPKLAESPIVWKPDDEVLYRASTDGRSYEIRVPDDSGAPLYELTIDGRRVGSLPEWPKAWQRPVRDLEARSKLQPPSMDESVGEPIKWEETGDAEFPYVAYWREHHYLVRLNDFPAEPMFTLFADGASLGHLEDWPPVWKRPRAVEGLLPHYDHEPSWVGDYTIARRMLAGVSDPFPRYFAVDRRPVKLVLASNGRLDPMVFDWRTGEFLIDDAYAVHVVSPAADTELLTEREFDDRVRGLRRGVVARYVLTPSKWERSDRGTGWYRAILDHRIEARTEESSARITLIVDGHELADVERWPEAWTRLRT